MVANPWEPFPDSPPREECPCNKSIRGARPTTAFLPTDGRFSAFPVRRLWKIRGVNRERFLACPVVSPETPLQRGTEASARHCNFFVRRMFDPWWLFFDCTKVMELTTHASARRFGLTPRSSSK